MSKLSSACAVAALLTAAPWPAASAQAAPLNSAECCGANAFTLDTGVTWMSRTDLMLSPRSYSGAMPRLGLGYDRRGSSWAHSAEFAVTKGSFSSQPDFDYSWDGETRSAQPSVVTMVDLRYAVGRRMELGRSTLHLGGTSANHVEDFINVYAWLGVSHYMGAFELGPWAEWTRPVGERHSLSIEGWVPVSAWIGRNPYAVHSGEHVWKSRDNSVPRTVVRHIADGRLHSLGSYQAAHVRGAWEFALQEHWALQLNLRGDLLHYTLPRPVVEAQLSGGLAVKGSF